MSVLDVILVI